ncbi:MAG: HAD hydrolase family protein, partial [Pseudomonadales bacterium]|nr:HAD hydrolase family protein [Pseudomonadales bacterium]
MSAGRALASLNATQLQALRRQAANTRLVFFDVDGTLVNSRRQVPQSARQAIRALRERGIKLA